MSDGQYAMDITDLNALPAKTVIRTMDGEYSSVYEKDPENGWDDREWFTINSDGIPDTAASIDLPAQVIFDPTKK